MPHPALDAARIVPPCHGVVVEQRPLPPPAVVDTFGVVAIGEVVGMRDLVAHVEHGDAPQPKAMPYKASSRRIPMSSAPSSPLRSAWLIPHRAAVPPQVRSSPVSRLTPNGSPSANDSGKSPR